MTDLKNEFAGLRAEEINRLTPPGVVAVRRTVRRRRQRRGALAAGLAVLLVAGGFAMGGTSAPPVPAAGPAEGPDLSNLWQRADEVISTVGSDAEVIRRTEPLNGDRSGVETPVTAGDYFLVGVCTGSGSATIAGYVKDGTAGSAGAQLSLQCDPKSPTPVEAPITVGRGGHLWMRVASERDPTDWAVYSFKVTRTDSTPLDAASGGTGRRAVIDRLKALKPGLTGTYGTGPWQTNGGDLAAGKYRIQVACAGDGSVTWQVRVDAADVRTGTVWCRAEKAGVESFDLARGETPQIRIDPSARSNWGYQVVPR